ncbi:HAD hydrolase family protein [Paenibacillus cisolokensis]|uniref:HAD hydrolase family protein n=1 Tax=Paenibacillus cisolokensis TaxID=1658519 RepID=UPI003D290CEB
MGKRAYITDLDGTVRNAQDAIKRLADEIVPSNDEDGVAAYLERETGAKAVR